MKGNFHLFLFAAVCLFFPQNPAAAQNTDIKFIADTLVIQADGTYEADPDLATLTFDISTQDKELKQTYDRASQSMQKIIALAEKNGLAKEDLTSGVFDRAAVLRWRQAEARQILHRPGSRDDEGARFLQAWADSRRVR